MYLLHNLSDIFLNTNYIMSFLGCESPRPISHIKIYGTQQALQLVFEQNKNMFTDIFIEFDVNKKNLIFGVDLLDVFTPKLPPFFNICSISELWCPNLKDSVLGNNFFSLETRKLFIKKVLLETYLFNQDHYICVNHYHYEDILKNATNYLMYDSQANLAWNKCYAKVYCLQFGPEDIYYNAATKVASAPIAEPLEKIINFQHEEKQQLLKTCQENIKNFGDPRPMLKYRK